MEDKWKHMKRWCIVTAAVVTAFYGIWHPGFSYVEVALITVCVSLGLYTGWALLRWLYEAMFMQESNVEDAENARFIVKGGHTLRVSLKQVGRYINATTHSPMVIFGYHVDRYAPEMATSYTDAPSSGVLLDTCPVTNLSPQFVNLDVDGNIQFLSSNVLDMFGLEFEAVLGQSISDMTHIFGHGTEAVLETVRQHYYAHQVFHTILNGRETWFLWTYEAVLDTHGQIDFIIAMVQDISGTMPRALGQDFQPERDYLTGQLNQVGLYKTLEAIQDVSEAVSIFIDIRQFSKINDYYGHHFGDKILLEVSQRLNQFTTHGGLLSRVSGDKFVLYLTQQHASRKARETMLHKLEAFLTYDLTIDGITLPLETAIGYAVYPEDCQTLDGLIALSSLAMEASASMKPMQISRYHPSMRDALHYDFLIAHKLKQALENETLEVHFQHVIDASSHDVVYLEALGRWYDDELGVVPPSTFFQAAEATHLLDTLDRQLAGKAIHAFKQVREKPLYQNARLSLNIAPDSLLDITFFQYVNATVEAAQIAYGDVCIEVSEKTFVSRIEQCREAIQKYKDMGYVIALDDFGKEYSSLAILDHLTFDIIKIDGAFTQSINTVKSQEIIKMIRNITHLSHKKLIIEGVETAAQSLAALELGCPLQQGFHHHRPARLN